jgi:hypothetical protein
MPSGVTVAPARRASSSPLAEPSSGCGLAMRLRAYVTIAFESASVSSV